MTIRRLRGVLRRVVCLFAMLAGTAVCLVPTRVEAQTTALFTDSQTGDAVGGGVQKTFLPSTGSTFTIQQTGLNAVSVRINGPGSGTFWFLDFNAPNNAPL